MDFLIVAFFGLCFGSFATALLYRIPRGLPWAGRERSRCTSCNAVLGFRDLIPVFSWLASRGTCRHCGAKIPITYPLIEIGGALIFLGFYVIFRGFSG